jgi:hypothetical protein
MSFTPFPVDDASQAVITIDNHHHEIHEGDAYFYSDSVTLASAATQDYLITTPNTTKWAHMVVEMDGTAVTTFQFYEGATRTGTTLQTLWNNNRNSANTAGVTIHKGATGGADGTLMKAYSSGTSSGNSKMPSTLGFGSEVILKQNTKYLVRITSGTAGNLCNINFNWYEHTSGE